MSQSSDSNIKDISKETAPKPIEDILQPAANPESEEKSDEGVLSKISSAADSLMNKITGNNTDSTEAVAPEAVVAPEAAEKEGSSGEEKEEMPAVLDISKESAAVQEEKEVVLKLGDIIYILDPTNEVLNENTFVINYIDPTKIKLINTKSFEPTQLNVKENGAIGNGTITEIKILSRNPKEGFAKQNDLLPGKWVNIYFGGDYPAVITGEITNLEEDMIELRTTEDDTIYINFAYQGIPENLPIETFEIRPAPEGSQGKEKNEGLEGEREELEEGEIMEFGDEPELEPEPEDTALPKREVRDKIKQFLIEGDQIIFGDVVQIQEFVNIDKDKYRYNIETQTNDLLEEMVSTIPSARRTPSVLNSIHIMITRFLQLRELSSQFDV